MGNAAHRLAFTDEVRHRYDSTSSRLPVLFPRQMDVLTAPAPRHDAVVEPEERHTIGLMRSWAGTRTPSHRPSSLFLTLPTLGSTGYSPRARHESPGPQPDGTPDCGEHPYARPAP